MSFWNTLKQKLRSFIPVSRTYMDNKLRELEKENRRQEKSSWSIQKNQPVHAGAEGICVTGNCIAGTIGENGLHRCCVKQKNARSG